MANRDENIVWLRGNVVADAELRKTSTGKEVANFRIATSEGLGESKKTDYHSIVAWEKLAEEAVLRAKTGARVAIEGRIQTRNYESKRHEGEKVYVTEVIASTIRFLAEPVEEDLSGINF